MYHSVLPSQMKKLISLEPPISASIHFVFDSSDVLPREDSSFETVLCPTLQQKKPDGAHYAAFAQARIRKPSKARLRSLGSLRSLRRVKVEGVSKPLQLKGLKPPFSSRRVSKPSKPSKGQRRLRSLPLLRSLRSPLRSPSQAFEGFEGGFEALKGGFATCLVSFSSYLFFFVFNTQKRSRVAFSFFRLERTLAFSEGGLFGFIFFLSLFLRF